MAQGYASVGRSRPRRHPQAAKRGVAADTVGRQARASVRRGLPESVLETAAPDELPDDRRGRDLVGRDGGEVFQELQHAPRLVVLASYTPYQAEISQGRLEALLNFQTAVISLTGMEIGNCSLLDEGTAAAEAMLMMFALRPREAVREGRNQLFVDRNIFPQTLDVLLTRSEPFGIELIIDEYDEYSFTGKEFGAIVQYPAANGAVRDYTDFTAAAHAKGVLVTAAADLLSLALLKSPGEWGADIAVGSTQRLGTPMGFGGPGAGYMATREAYKRNMPGRIIGVSVDRLGNKALRMALQMREQHIKRERATSNICTASALMASMAGFYCVYNGPEGLKRAADTAHLAAATVADALQAMDYKLAAADFFDTLEVSAEAAVVQCPSVRAS